MRLPKKITVDLRPGKEPVTIDGEAFPWAVSADRPVQVEIWERGRGIQVAVLTLLAEHVEVIPAEGREVES